MKPARMPRKAPGTMKRQHEALKMKDDTQRDKKASNGLVKALKECIG